MPIEDYINQQLINQKQFRIFDIIDSIILFVLDVRNIEILFVSDSVKGVVGYSSGEFIKGGIKLFNKLVVPDDHLKVKEFFINNSSNLVKRNDHNLLDFRVKHKDGHLIWMEFKFFKYVESDDKRRFLIGVLKDISKGKQREQFLWKKLEENVTSLNKLKKIRRIYSHFFRRNGNTKQNSTLNNSDKLLIKVNGNNQFVTKREREVLQLIANGYSTKQIASKLNISYHTVVSHRKNIISKFQVQNTAELINKALNSFWL